MATTEHRVDILDASLASLRNDGDAWLRPVQSESQRVLDNVQVGVAQTGAESTSRLTDLTAQLQALFLEIKQEFEKHHGELESVAGNWVDQQVQIQQGLKALPEETKRHVDSLLARV